MTKYEDVISDPEASVMGFLLKLSHVSNERKMLAVAAAESRFD